MKKEQLTFYLNDIRIYSIYSVFSLGYYNVIKFNFDYKILNHIRDKKLSQLYINSYRNKTLIAKSQVMSIEFDMSIILTIKIEFNEDLDHTPTEYKSLFPTNLSLRTKKDYKNNIFVINKYLFENADFDGPAYTRKDSFYYNYYDMIYTRSLYRIIYATHGNFCYEESGEPETHKMKMCIYILNDRQRYNLIEFIPEIASCNFKFSKFQSLNDNKILLKSFNELKLIRYKDIPHELKLETIVNKMWQTNGLKKLLKL